MDGALLLAGLGAAVLVGLLAMAVMLRKPEVAPAIDSPYAVSTEGEKRCPKCGMGNLWTDRNCISCKARLAG